MILWKTAWKNICNTLALNIITVLQMVATMIITVILISSILLRYQYYSPMKDYFQANGIYGIFPLYAMKNQENGINVDNWLDDDGLKAELDGAQEVIGSAFTYCTLPDGSSINSYAYTDNLIDHFTPRLESGRWLSTSNNTNQLEVVISQNDFGWKVGDIIELSFFHAAGITNYEFCVVGILEEDAKIPSGMTNSKTIDFMHFYQTYSFHIEETPVVLMNLEALKGLHDGPDILRAMTASYIVTYPNNYTEDQLNVERSKLAEYGSAVTILLSEMQDNNRHYLYRQMYDLLPVILVLLVLTGVGCISSGALTTRSRLHDYAIYYVTGLQWKQCIRINLIQSSICGGFSAVTSIIILKTIQYTNLSNYCRVIWSPQVFIGIMVIFIIYLLISTLMPIIIIGRSTPKQILAK